MTLFVTYMGEKWRTGADGILELVDETTGNVILRQKTKGSSDPTKSRGGPKPGRRANAEPQTHHWVLDGTGRKIWVPKGTDPDSLPRLVYPFSQTTCDHILQAVTEGQTIKEIGATEGYPPAHIIHKWLREYSEFKADMKKAREARAEWFADEAIGTAKEADEDNVQSSRLKVDTFKWAAEVNDPGTYGKRTKIVGDPEAPIGFIIDTGVPIALPEPKPAPKDIDVQASPVPAITQQTEEFEEVVEE